MKMWKEKSGSKVQSMITYFDNLPFTFYPGALFKMKKLILIFFFDVNKSAEDWLNSQFLSFSDILFLERRKIPSQAKNEIFAYAMT